MTPSGSSQRPLRLQQKCLNINDNQKPGQTALLSERKLHQMWQVFVSRPSQGHAMSSLYRSSKSWCRSRMMHLWRQKQKEVRPKWLNMWANFKHRQHLQMKLKWISCFGAFFLFQDVTFSFFHALARWLSASAITFFFLNLASFVQ